MAYTIHDMPRAAVTVEKVVLCCWRLPRVRMQTGGQVGNGCGRCGKCQRAAASRRVKVLLRVRNDGSQQVDSQATRCFGTRGQCLRCRRAAVRCVKYAAFFLRSQNTLSPTWQSSPYRWGIVAKLYGTVMAAKYAAMPDGRWCSARCGAGGK